MDQKSPKMFSIERTQKKSGLDISNSSQSPNKKQKTQKKFVLTASKTGSHPSFLKSSYRYRLYLNYRMARSGSKGKKSRFRGPYSSKKSFTITSSRSFTKKLPKLSLMYGPLKLMYLGASRIRKSFPSKLNRTSKFKV